MASKNEGAWRIFVAMLEAMTTAAGEELGHALASRFVRWWDQEEPVDAVPATPTANEFRAIAEGHLGFTPALDRVAAWTGWRLHQLPLDVQAELFRRATADGLSGRSVLIGLVRLLRPPV